MGSKSKEEQDGGWGRKENGIMLKNFLKSDLDMEGVVKAIRLIKLSRVGMGEDDVKMVF